ncbi:MAG: hypothetical protein KBC93_17520 [Candidatus Microthrix sp.]|nr:hypothetical protein [Dermatophilaceae bacterium]MBP9836087.1 hypothetical protein [Candidatus Microthrix sp.]
MKHFATIEEIAALHGWTISYARKVASREQWRRRRRPDRRAEYSLRDVSSVDSREAMGYNSDVMVQEV